MMGIDGASDYIHLEYVSLTSIKNERNIGLSFFEYEYLCSNITTIEKVIKENLDKPSKRNIEGYMIDCSKFRIQGF